MTAVTPAQATAAVRTPEASGAQRPTAPAATSSSRPDSSSARVCRVTSSRLMIAVRSAPDPLIRQPTSPPVVVRSNGRPVRAIRPGLAAT